MKSKNNLPFSNLKFENWKNLLFFAIICCYFITFFLYFVYDDLGGDYQAYWITGKIADTKGYSEIYNLSEMKIVYRQIINDSGDQAKIETLLSNISPAPYFSVFFIPFQFLSRISVINGYKLWTFFNLVLLLGYLIFFLRRMDSRNHTYVSDMKLLIPFLISYPVFFNISCGQVEVFVLICAGEFLRNAAKKRPIISGLWLGGLLLKPQLLILVIPIFIIMRYWKALLGFFASSGIILLISLWLSGLAGMRALINLWTNYSDGVALIVPEIMINWRMVGVIINNLLNTSFGSVITGLGIILTILAVFFLIKQIPSYGSSLWVIKMIGVFAATLAITWHSNYHMAMVLIPFLVYALVNKLLPEKFILLWGITASVIFLGTRIIELFFFGLTKIDYFNFHLIVIAFIGLISNILILIFMIQYNDKLETSLTKRLSINYKS